jgi:hypothetical protein
MEEALVSVMWAGLLRPGEAVLTPLYPKFDVTRHRKMGNVRFFTKAGVRCEPGRGDVPARLELDIDYSKTDQRRMAAYTVVVGATGDLGFCPVMAMWAYLEARGQGPPEAPLFTLGGGKPATYACLCALVQSALRDGGMPAHECKHYAGHSFRIGGAQALALAGRSVEYVMAMGRWRCLESVMTYVGAPHEMRMTDVADMLAASHDGAHAAAASATVFRATAVAATSTVAAARLRTRTSHH